MHTLKAPRMRLNMLAVCVDLFSGYIDNDRTPRVSQCSYPECLSYAEHQKKWT